MEGEAVDSSSPSQENAERPTVPRSNQRRASVAEIQKKARETPLSEAVSNEFQVAKQWIGEAMGKRERSKTNEEFEVAKKKYLIIREELMDLKSKTNRWIVTNERRQRDTFNFYQSLAKTGSHAKQGTDNANFKEIQVFIPRAMDMYAIDKQRVEAIKTQLFEPLNELIDSNVGTIDMMLKKLASSRIKFDAAKTKSIRVVGKADDDATKLDANSKLEDAETVFMKTQDTLMEMIALLEKRKNTFLETCVRDHISKQNKALVESFATLTADDPVTDQYIAGELENSAQDVEVMR